MFVIISLMILRMIVSLIWAGRMAHRLDRHLIAAVDSDRWCP